MRLLNARTIEVEEYLDGQTPRYAILSHRWEQEEILFTDVQSRQFRHKHGFRKVQLACEQTLNDNLDFIWIDTCCIDKSSSAELSEAINSMFDWYAKAAVCYAYLSDVDYAGPASRRHENASIMNSAWFKRGWTLQELIAPSTINFYTYNWLYLGTRDKLSKLISGITGVPYEVLRDRRGHLSRLLASFTIAQKMSWAAARKTTRIEDRAYSLMGLFNVNMPLLYGESARAFIRLQEEILKVGTDLSILAWNYGHGFDGSRREVLASSPDDFKHGGNIVRSPSTDELTVQEIALSMTNVGLRIDNPFLVESGEGPSGRGLLLSLECHNQVDIIKTFALKVEPLEQSRSWDFNLRQAQRTHSTLCIAGWETDAARRKDRLMLVGVLAPQRSPSWPSMTIRRELTTFQLNWPDAAQWHTHIWVQLPSDPLRPPWTVLKVYPPEKWDLTALTTTISEYQNRAIALTDNLGNNLALFFEQDFEHVDGFPCNAKLKRWITDHDEDFPRPPYLKIGRWSSWQTEYQLAKEYRIITRLENVKRPGILIGQVILEVEAGNPPICYPPYELEAPPCNPHRNAQATGILHITTANPTVSG